MDQHGEHRLLVRHAAIRQAAILAIAALWLGVSPAPAKAQEPEQCRLALSLALDVSASVDADEYDLQRIGLAAALNAPDVRHSILNGGAGYVALSIYEWSGYNQQKLHLDWRALRTGADINAAVALILDMSRSHDDFPTSVGQALAYGATLMGRAPYCERRVIDMSGDGINNHGFGPANAFRHFDFNGITVNGLVITGNDEGVFAFYLREVLHGLGAFAEVANGFDDFERAMTRKLYREINNIAVGNLHQPRARPGHPKG